MGLSTHILDTARGRPAANISVVLFQFRDEAWHRIGEGVTDTDGRCRTLLNGQALATAIYRLRFEIASYFAAQQQASLYPFVEISFSVTEPAEHHHIPLLLAANGYTTYRGS